MWTFEQIVIGDNEVACKLIVTISHLSFLLHVYVEYEYWQWNCLINLIHIFHMFQLTCLLHRCIFNHQISFGFLFTLVTITIELPNHVKFLNHVNPQHGIRYRFVFTQITITKGTLKSYKNQFRIYCECWHQNCL